MFGLTPAPELCRSNLVWFNVEYPLALADLRGRLIILDFWTPCCVNCLHVLPILRTLEKTFGDRLLVIGVNSPKYPAERDPKCLANAIDRLDIRHPVIHDPNFCLWRAYGVSAWPTLVFIGPDGKVVGELRGEPLAERLIFGVGQMIRQWTREGLQTPLPLPADRDIRRSRSSHTARPKPPSSRRLRPFRGRGGSPRPPLFCGGSQARDRADRPVDCRPRPGSPARSPHLATLPRSPTGQTSGKSSRSHSAPAPPPRSDRD